MSTCLTVSGDEQIIKNSWAITASQGDQGRMNTKFIHFGKEPIYPSMVPTSVQFPFEIMQRRSHVQQLVEGNCP